MNHRNILVTGATGYVGSRLVNRLLEKNYTVRCMARNPAKLNTRKNPELEVVYGDVLDQSSLYDALHDIDVAYYLIHGMTGTSDFESKDAQSAQNFATVAAAKKVKRIIYLGGLGDDTKDLSPHLSSRQEVGNILSQQGVPVTELRASIIIGSGSASFEIIRDLVKKLPVMITPRWVRSKCQPIGIRDVLSYLVNVIETEETTDKKFDIGGDEVLSYTDMMRRVAQIYGKKLYIFNVPVLTPHLSAYWLNLVTAVPMRLAFPLIEGLRNDTICQNHEIEQLVPLKKTPFDEAVRRALNREKDHTIESHWTGADTFSTVVQTNSATLLSDERCVDSHTSARDIFKQVQIIGGENGWYYGNWAWRLRGILDRLIGGVGMRRGRRHPVDLRVGDVLDFWRVDHFDPGKSLKLRAEMKVPGTAWLEFVVEKTNNGGRLKQTAYFIPGNLFGYIYWYVLAPAHFLIFRNMARNIVKTAEATT